MYLNNTCLHWYVKDVLTTVNSSLKSTMAHNVCPVFTTVPFHPTDVMFLVLTFIFTKQFMILSLIQSAEPDGHMMIMTNPRFCLFVFCKETVLWTFIPSFKMVSYFFQRYSWTDVKTSLFSAERYRTVLLNILILDIQERGCLQSTVFMQNGELLHIRLRMPEVFWQHFTHNCIISRELLSK